MDSGFDPTLGALNTAMNLRLVNQNVIASNIANADTPGYKAKTMEFEQAFRSALQSGEPTAAQATHPKHIVVRDTDPVHPVIYDDPRAVEGLDGNSVNRAQEMSKMLDNQLQYDAAAEMVKRKLAMLKYAISEGGGNR